MAIPACNADHDASRLYRIGGPAAQVPLAVPYIGDPAGQVPSAVPQDGAAQMTWPPIPAVPLQNKTLATPLPGGPLIQYST